MSVKSVTISNFRSIQNELCVPLNGKMTFLVGPNNSGKSNILRALAVLFNKSAEAIIPDLDFATNNKVARFAVKFESAALREIAAQRRALHSYLTKVDSESSFNVIVEIGQKQISSRLDHDIFSIVPEKYFSSDGGFLHDFGQSASVEQNVAQFLQSLDWSKRLAVPLSRSRKEIP